ncbi:expressed unknown protein [Seminavis robusta]|uniref:Uncharacterized protein n=1 Tax=Seminavis robusta TaxID=568900 RepID=A0A9N8F0H5_9STRA|nr:expressed unknown protein [Seminavis robusta]|eukprot:Sro2451_g328110.1 n/a (279) ;mRNA; r:6728-7749
MDYTAASQALGPKRFSVLKTYQSIPEASDLEWSDDFFEGDDGIVAVFDFDYLQIVDFNTQMAFAGLVPTLGSQIEWEAYAQHVAVTVDGIRFVQDKRKSCWGISVCDKGRHSKTVPFDKITDCDIVEPAGAECLCIPRVLMTVNIDTASSGGESRQYELKITGLQDAHRFKQLVWAMKRATRGGGTGAAPAYYQAPQALEMTERANGSSAANALERARSGESNGTVKNLLRDIRTELRENNQLMREMREKEKDQGIEKVQGTGSCKDAAATFEKGEMA